MAKWDTGFGNQGLKYSVGNRASATCSPDYSPPPMGPRVLMQWLCTVPSH